MNTSVLQNDRDYQAFCERCDEQHYAHIEAAHQSTIEPIEVTIKRATGQDVVSISIYDPQLDAKLRAVWGSWK